jgi:hypothetical protein
MPVSNWEPKHFCTTLGRICASPRRRDDLAHPRRHAFGRLENFLLATLLER